MNVKIKAVKLEDILEVTQLLKRLSDSPLLTLNSEVEIFNKRGLTCYHLVAKADEELVGTASLFILNKYSHSGRPVGYIDDVVVKEGWDGKGIGHQLIDNLIRLAKIEDCHKIILGCKKSLIPYYEKFGFEESNVEMRLDLI